MTMEEKKTNKLLSMVLNNLTDEQNEKLSAYATLQEAFEKDEALVIALPDEILNTVTGGVSGFSMLEPGASGTCKVCGEYRPLLPFGMCEDCMYEKLSTTNGETHGATACK